MIFPMLIDCDIHVGCETLTDLLPYLDAPTRELVINSGSNGLAMPSYPWNHPTGWLRHDVYERGSGHDANFAYMSLDTLRERHLDTYDVTPGVVEPDEAAAFSVIPNAQLATRLCSAYNDWLLEQWLQEEPRLRGMIVVPAQHPQAAAQLVPLRGAVGARRGRAAPARPPRRDSPPLTARRRAAARAPSRRPPPHPHREGAEPGACAPAARREHKNRATTHGSRHARLL